MVIDQDIIKINVYGSRMCLVLSNQSCPNAKEVSLKSNEICGLQRSHCYSQISRLVWIGLL